MQGSRFISQPFVYSQSYLADSLDNPQIYSESFSIAKINIEGLRSIKIFDLKQFVLNEWRKNAPETAIKIGFLFGNEIEKQFFDSNHLYVNYSGLSLIKPTDENDIILSATDQKEIATRFIYREVSISNLADFADLRSFNIARQGFYDFPINKSVPDVTNNPIYFLNTYNHEHLYIITYCPILLRGEFYFSGNLNFFLEGE
jgi:hypothetical protein